MGALQNNLMNMISVFVKRLKPRVVSKCYQRRFCCFTGNLVKLSLISIGIKSGREVNEIMRHLVGVQYLNLEKNFLLVKIFVSTC